MRKQERCLERRFDVWSAKRLHTRFWHSQVKRNMWSCTVKEEENNFVDFSLLLVFRPQKPQLKLSHSIQLKKKKANHILTDIES